MEDMIMDVHHVLSSPNLEGTVLKTNRTLAIIEI